MAFLRIGASERYRRSALVVASGLLLFGVASGSQIGTLTSTVVHGIANRGADEETTFDRYTGMFAASPLRRPMMTAEGGLARVAVADLSGFDDFSTVPARSSGPSAMDRIGSGLNASPQKPQGSDDSAHLSEAVRDRLSMALQQAIDSGNAEQVTRVVDDFCVEHMDVSTDIFVAATAETHRIIGDACSSGKAACRLKDEVSSRLQNRFLALRAESLGGGRTPGSTRIAASEDHPKNESEGVDDPRGIPTPIPMPERPGEVRSPSTR